MVNSIGLTSAQQQQNKEIRAACNNGITIFEIMQRWRKITRDATQFHDYKQETRPNHTIVLEVITSETKARNRLVTEALIGATEWER